MVNNFVASVIYQKCFRGLKFNSGTRKYSFEISFAADDIPDIIFHCDRAGHVVYEQEIGQFLDQTIGYSPIFEEWRRLPLDSVVNGECISLRGLNSSNERYEIEIIKLTASHYLALEKDLSHQNLFRTLGIIDIPESYELETDRKLETLAFSIKPDLIRIELPSLFHRIIDRIVLNMEYVSNGPGNILKLYNELIDRHLKHSIASEMESTMDLISQYGVSTFVLRKLLDYICLSNEY